MELNVWKVRALLVFVLSLCVTVTIALFSGEPEAIKVDSSVLPALPVSQEQVIGDRTLQEQQKSRDANNLKPNQTANTAIRYRPRYEISWAHPLNYGERFARDIYGRTVTNQPIIVLHETVYSATSAINFFQTPHVNENQQASYHTLIKLDGTVIYIVPPDKRAFGAANSIFEGENGPETVKTHPKFPPSVNNFAYHVSLETPPDGRNNKRKHSGYTNAQYRSLAWLIAQSQVPDSRITTHQFVDRSGSRIDPRSFDTNKFLNLLHSFRRESSKLTLNTIN